MPPPMSNKDGMQVLKLSFDESAGAIRVLADITSVITDLNIRASNGDNIAIADQSGTNKMAVNPDGSINVTDNGGSFTVDAVNLDIRDLSASQDSVRISDGTDTLAINPDGSINTDATISGEVSIEVSAADGDNIAISDGVDTMTVNADGSINVDASQTGTWSVNVNNATGAAAVNIQDGGNSITVDGTVSIGSGAAVIGHVILDSGTLTSITNVVHIDDNGGSITVDGTVAATQSGTWNINNISGTVSLPTGASTLAAQTTGNSSLSSIDGKLNSLGQKASAASVPVVIASDQSAVATKASTPTAGTVTQAAISVGTSAVRATVAGTAPSATRSLLVINPDSASSAKFYVGASTVTSSGANRGMQLIGGDKVAFNSDAGDYYIISDTAAQTVYIVEQA